MKTVLITGASGGLGTIVTERFLEAGYRVIAVCGSHPCGGRVFGDQATGGEFSGGHPLGIGHAEHPAFERHVVDLTDEEAAADFVAGAIRRHGDIHAALLLAGGFRMGNIAASPIGDVRRQLTLNFETAYTVVRPLFGHFLLKGSGRIVLIGARAAMKPEQGKGLLAYSLSKSLLFRLAELLNEEAKGTSVTVSVVVPSTLDTPVNRKSMPDADPSGWVDPKNLAEVLEFLVSERGSALRETVLKVYNNA
ncbi:MAG TPA: SDR family NAD(P)-dependent oxidoreductase [Puia sp.]|uniref:SDR family NAD(P)-dependent oxidoreductase n=1 Tax=Puia sp. TaxID=2045100 RepID=UPI002C9187E9|nr:SDR family NAD(P)-dependent oxidoreductase [Puia sp.]HVU94437.1 SDR family NAD(P)-dependent oxidoreductase [Puia sp.]